MIAKYLRPGITKIINPIARVLLKIGVTPNIMTVFGTVLNCVLAITFVAVLNQLMVGALVLGACVFVDLVDGAMARQVGRGTPFGSVLDATMDRIADGVIFASLLWWEFTNRPYDIALMVATIITLITSEVISYAKAKAEASGFPITVGIIERPERLIIGLVGTFFAGIGLLADVPEMVNILDAAMWILAVLSIVTVVQRLWAVYKSPGATSDFGEQ